LNAILALLILLFILAFPHMLRLQNKISVITGAAQGKVWNF